MSHELGQIPALEGLGQSSEVSPFVGLDDANLVVQFFETGRNPAIARELSAQLLRHAGYSGDPTTEPLTGEDGRQLQDTTTGQRLVLADYLGFAGEHHPYALRQILSFLYTEPGDPAYEAGRAAYARYVNPESSQSSSS